MDVSRYIAFVNKNSAHNQSISEGFSFEIAFLELHWANCLGVLQRKSLMYTKGEHKLVKDNQVL